MHRLTLVLSLLLIFATTWSQDLANTAAESNIYFAANNSTEIWRGTSNSDAVLFWKPSEPAFSIGNLSYDPSTDQLAYSNYVKALWVINGDGTNNRKVGDVRDIHGVNWIAGSLDVVGNYGSPGNYGLSRINVITGAISPWIPASLFASYGLNTFRDAARWSADRSRLVLDIGVYGGGSQTAFVADIDFSTGTLTNIQRLSPLGGGWSTGSMSVDISPDGTTAYYVWREGYNGPVTIHRVALDGGIDVPLRTIPLNYSYLRLSADGTRIWFTGKRADGIFTLGSIKNDGTDYQEVFTSSTPFGDFAFGLPAKGIIAGTTSSATTTIAGVTVKLVDRNGLPVGGYEPAITNSDGIYTFNQVSAGEYQILIVEPLGFLVDGNPKAAVVGGGVTTYVDFALSPLAVSNEARGAGYWKHQFDVYVTGKGHAQESEADLNCYIDRVHSHYTPHFALLSGLQTLNDWQGVMSPAKGATTLQRASTQLAALVLNLVSLKLGQQVMVTVDGRDAADLLTYVSNLLADTEPANDAVAKDLCELANTQQTIPSGVVPAGSVLYKGGQGSIAWRFGVPASIMLHANYPNPFNPATTISFDLPEPAEVKLTIVNSLGQVIATLVNDLRAAGTHSITWDGRGTASGSYFCRMVAGSYVKVNRMLLLK